MKIDRHTGLVEGVRHVPSPNQDERPEGCEPELVVVHGISLPPGELGGPWIDRLFTNRLDPEAHPYFREIADLRVSAHALVRRDGAVTQYVPFHRRARHAGVSRWRGREAVNDFSVGIELEGTDDTPYEKAQYRRLAELVHALADAYPAITADRIVGHSEIAPGRKTDPGPSFAWEYFIELLGAR